MSYLLKSFTFLKGLLEGGLYLFLFGRKLFHLKKEIERFERIEIEDFKIKLYYNVSKF